MGRQDRSRITVVDDSQEFLGMLVELLGEDGDGYHVTAMHGEVESFEDIVRTRPKLLIVDLVLRNNGTHLSGWELVLLSRFHRRLREVPLIVCSGDTRQLQERADQLAELAMAHILTKPSAWSSWRGWWRGCSGSAGAVPEAPPAEVGTLHALPSSDAGRGTPTNAPGEAAGAPRRKHPCEGAAAAY